MKIYFEYEKPKLKTQCKHVAACKIGSAMCQRCFYFKSISLDEKWVDCSFK